MPVPAGVLLPLMYSGESNGGGSEGDWKITDSPDGGSGDCAHLYDTSSVPFASKICRFFYTFLVLFIEFNYALFLVRFRNNLTFLEDVLYFG